MIYICNNCVGGRIYQLLNIQFNNPFIWARLSSTDMDYIINNFETINFEIYEIVSYFDKILLYDVYGLKIDNKFIIWYPHYRYSKKHNVPTKTTLIGGIDIYFNNIEQYIIEKYIIRKNRMYDCISKGDKIKFIVVEGNKQENMNYGTLELEHFTKYNDIPVFSLNNINNTTIKYKKEWTTTDIAKLYLKTYNK